MEYRIALAPQLSSQIKSLRKQRGLTQKQLGEKLGLTQRRIATIEAHPERTSVERILQILSELGADLIIRERGFDPSIRNLNKATW